MSDSAGWFPDPARTSDTFRWWDGRRWTRWLSRNPGASDPGAEPELRPTEAAPAPGSAPTDGRRMRLPVVVALVIGVLLVALVGVGLTVILTEDRIRSGPAIAPPSAAPPPGLVLDPETRTVRVENVQLTLPGSPYVCAESPLPLSPSLGSALTCDTAVHTDYAGTDDWYATTGLGLVEESLVVPGDLARTGRNVYAGLRRQFFAGRRTTVQKFDQPANPVGRDRGVFFVGEVHYAITGLPSRYDRMVVGVIQLPSGRHAAFFSVRPDDASAATLAALNRSLETLSAR